MEAELLRGVVRGIVRAEPRLERRVGVLGVEDEGRFGEGLALARSLGGEAVGWVALDVPTL